VSVPVSLTHSTVTLVLALAAATGPATAPPASMATAKIRAISRTASVPFHSVALCLAGLRPGSAPGVQFPLHLRATCQRPGGKALIRRRGSRAGGSCMRRSRAREGDLARARTPIPGRSLRTARALLLSDQRLAERGSVSAVSVRRGRTGEFGRGMCRGPGCHRRHPATSQRPDQGREHEDEDDQEADVRPLSRQ
jgi:hypothetical protein